MSDPIFSVGHGARTAEALVAVLRGAGIRRLVDVRTKPGSRRHPQFGQTALADTLDAAGIGYRWEKDLGGFREAKPGSPHVALPAGGFRGYADHMETATFARALALLGEDAAREPTAFMCAETLWTNCHRRMISDALTVASWEVVHLIEPTRREPHQLHPALRIVDGHLLYDAGGNGPDQVAFEL
jgi:uncharacterized protein (DUF488 family)